MKYLFNFSNTEAIDLGRKKKKGIIQSAVNFLYTSV